MPDQFLERIFAEVRKPAVEALDQISPHMHSVARSWKKSVRSGNLSPQALRILAKLDLEAGLRQLREVTHRGLCSRLAGLGEELAEAGVAIEQALAAFDLLLAQCVPYLRGDSAAVLSAVRLFDLCSVMLSSGYSQYWKASQLKLNVQLSSTEGRLTGASAYVTQVYEQERRRLSHDLHDEVGHDLMLLKLYLEVMKMDAANGMSRMRPKIEEALSVVGHAIDSTRRLVLDLGPAIFEELGFLAAIRFYIDQFSDRTGIRVVLHEDGVPEELPMTHQVALYRVLQGALSNVLRHAMATRVKVNLRTERNGMLMMTIEDNGTGFDPATQKPTSVGLVAMRERVRVLGGRFQVESSRAGSLRRRHGTRIEVEVPLPRTERTPVTHRPRARS